MLKPVTRVVRWPSFQATVTSLWLAWIRGDADGALRLAPAEIVDALFAIDPGDASRWSQPASCRQKNALTECKWETSTERLAVVVIGAIVISIRLELR
jgi:hypothetical protein